MRMTVLKSFANSTRETRARAMLLWIAAMAIAAGLSTIPVHGEAVSGEPTRHVVSVIDRADIKMSGFSSLSELLGSRTRFNSFGLYGARFGTGSVNLLVNGRDVSGLDYSTLPIAAVERVEILDQGPVRHGVYGLGSVINIVLRSDYEGTEVSAGAGLPTQKGRDSQHGSALWGGTLGRGHVTIGVAHIGREEVRDSDRDFSKARWTPGGSFADTTGVAISGNTLIAVPADADPPRAKAFSLGSCDPSVYTGVLHPPRRRGLWIPLRPDQMDRRIRSVHAREPVSRRRAPARRRLGHVCGGSCRTRGFPARLRSSSRHVRLRGHRKRHAEPDRQYRGTRK